MKNFNIPQRADMDAKGHEIYDSIHQSLGFVPNLYLGIGNSSNAWAGYMALQASNGDGTFIFAIVRSERYTPDETR
jgi:hypothetical protein